MSARAALAARLLESAGLSAGLEDLGDGWPTLAWIKVGDDRVPVALYVARVGLSHRGRDSVERRFQNPASGSSLLDDPSRLSLLLGVWEEDNGTPFSNPVIVSADAVRRSDGRTTRWSVFVDMATLRDAQRTGWSTYDSNSGEVITAFHPALLPVVAANLEAQVAPDEREIRRSLTEMGLGIDPGEAPLRDRVSRLVTSLVRDARFRGRVLDAYSRRCLLCGVGLGLVQGAHIYPVSASDSSDEVSNGLAFCANHHLAFDRFLFAVDVRDFAVVFRPDVVDEALMDEGAEFFVSSSFVSLGIPGGLQHRVADNLARRYAFFREEYEWLAPEARSPSR